MRKNERLIDIRPYPISGFIMQSPHLIDARVLREGLNNWFMRLVYSYEDEKGVHKVIFPKVEFPFPTLSIPVPSNEALSDRHYYGTGVKINYNPCMFISPSSYYKIAKRHGSISKV